MGTPNHLPKLLEGEEIVRVRTYRAPLVRRRPTDLQTLSRLVGAKNRHDIGRFGPVMAALPMRQRIASKVFRRYDALFGRDSLRVAHNLVDEFPQLARSTLLVLAELQGTAYDDMSEEEPGRIVHEVRNPNSDPVAKRLARERDWRWPYYGTVDATPEFVRLLGAYCGHSTEGYAFLKTEYVGRDNRIHTVTDALTSAVDWMVRGVCSNREGLLEFCRRNPKGLENQVWKDSWDAYFHADGTIANHKRGIASVEVQAAAYDALLDAANIYEAYAGKGPEAHELRQRAKVLKNAVLKHFWVDECGGYFALGTDRSDRGALRPLRIRTSNMGHLLQSRLLMGDEPDICRKRDAVIRQLFSPQMFCLNGIRTLACDEVRFRPGAYHNGSCWAWDNYAIAQGLDMHGYAALGDYIEQTIVEDVDYARRFVEFMRGDDDPEYRININLIDVWDSQYQRLNPLEQPPQDMQAWTLSAVMAIRRERRMRRYSRLSFDPKKRELEKEVLRRLMDFRRALDATSSKTRR